MKFFNKPVFRTVLAVVFFGCLTMFFMKAVLAEDTSGAVALVNPLPSSDLLTVLTTVIKTVFAFTGILALVQFIYGGLLWLTSAGNQEKITKGKNTLLWAVLGIVIVFMSYALVRFVIENITKPPGA
jgi:hypothetical protein